SARVDRPGAILAQVARLLELPAQGQHAVLHHVGGASNLAGDRRMITPISLVHRPPAGAAKPPLHGGQGDVMRARHRAQRGALTDGRYHRPPFRLPTLAPFLAIAPSLRGLCPSIVTEKLWHFTDREGVTPGSLSVDLAVKWLEFLKAAVPALARVAVLFDPLPGRKRQQVETTAPRLGLKVVTLEARSRDDIDRAF